MSKKTTELTKIDPKVKTRLLLNLWNLGGTETQINKSELTQQVKSSTEKAQDYQRVYEELEKEGAIALLIKGRSIKVSLTEQGLILLDARLKSSEFEYRPQQRVKTKDFNALLHWIKEGGIKVSNGKGEEKKAIASYEEFKQIALETYNRLNEDYNLGHFVPIYRMRREIGDRVSRSQFSEWMLQMQVEDIFHLIGGEGPDVTPDQLEDSIQPLIGNLRFYAKLLDAEV